MKLRTLVVALCVGGPVLLRCAEPELHRYTYDGAGRLVAAQQAGAGGVQYRWDAAGNLVERFMSQGADSDGDGLPDDWEQAAFGNLGRDGRGDADGDGMSDAAEWRAGTDPTKAASLLRVVQVRVDDTQRVEIAFTSVAGRRYRVEWTPALAPAAWVGLGEVAAAGESSRWSGPVGPGGAGYLRLVVLP